MGHAGDFAARNKRKMRGRSSRSSVAVAVARLSHGATASMRVARSVAKRWSSRSARRPATPSPEGVARTTRHYPTKGEDRRIAAVYGCRRATSFKRAAEARSRRGVLVASHATTKRRSIRPGRVPRSLGQSARLGKADAQLRAGQHDAAIASFKELSERTDSAMPKEALLLELARAYKVAGKNEDAKKTLTQIVEQHGDSPAAAAAKQELEKIPG